MSHTTSIDFNTFAFNVGEQSRKTRDASLPLHKAYTKAEPEQQRDLRTRWMLNHLRGALAVNAKTAERILSEGKGTGAKPEHIKAIDKASSDFRYHIARPESKQAKAPAKHNRVSVAHREAAMAFLSEFEGETLDEQIKAALEVLRAL
jgi:hypothetical protein